MPNHVLNEIDFFCSEEKFNEIKNFMKTDESLFDFNQLIPMPTDDDFIRPDTPLSFEAQKKSNGRNWYDWSVENWGTKWNAYEIEWNDGSVRFQTAWSAVPKIINALSKKFFDVTMDYQWADEDVGYNCGFFKIRNGCSICHKNPIGGSKEAFEHSFQVWGGSPEDFYLRYDENEGTYVYDESLWG